MIELKDIHIKFRDPIIEHGTITLLQHQLTLLTGASGSGKSSLLNILGLLDDTNQFQYLWDKKEIATKDYEKLKQYEIAYVFQNYSLIGDLNIEDNFKAMYQIAGIPFNKQRMQELLQEVVLQSLSLKQKVKSLSGGEQQRLAIALALVKEPKLLLLDEPTANLDEINSEIIIKILHQIKMKDIMIVVATHHPERYHADHIYEIKECSIVEVHTTKAIETKTNAQIQSRKSFVYFAYAKLHLVSHFPMYGLLLIALLLSFFGVSNGLSDIFSTKQSIDDMIESIAADELFITNTETLISDSTKYYFDTTAYAFTKEQLNELAAIPHIKNLYPFFVLTDPFFPTLENDGSITLRIKKFDDVEPIDPIFTEITYQNQKINVKDILSDVVTFSTCDKEKMSRISIKEDKQVNSGVFIPKQLADALHINKLDHTEIQLYMPIYMGYVTSNGGILDSDIIVETHPVSSLYCKTKLEVQGIYVPDISTTQYYDIDQGIRIFIDYQTAQQYHNEMIKDKELMKKYRDAVTEQMLDGHDFYVNDTSSAYIAQIDDPQFTEDVREQVYKTLDNVYIKSKATEKSSLYQSLSEVAAMSLLMPMIIFLVITVLMMILYAYTLHARKKEIAFLRANGIRISHRIPFLNQLIILIPACFLGFILSFVLGIESCNTEIMAKVLFTDILALLLLISTYYFISYRYFKHLDIRKELHSN